MLSSKTIILLKNIRIKPILVNLGKPVGKTFEIKCVNHIESSQMIFPIFNPNLGGLFWGCFCGGGGGGKTTPPPLSKTC